MKMEVGHVAMRDWDAKVSKVTRVWTVKPGGMVGGGIAEFS